MKKRIWLCCLLALCVLFFAGCGANPAGMQVPASTTSSELTEGEDNFTSEDVKTFTFEGEEYTFPLAYDVLTEQGWTITEYSYELLSEEDLNTSFLDLENSAYPGVMLEIYIYNSLDENSALGSVEELAEEFETNGIWGINIAPVDDETKVANYPQFSIQGVTFGDSVQDIVNTFGPNQSLLDMDDMYSYTEWVPEGTGSSLRFEVRDNAVCAIYIRYYV